MLNDSGSSVAEPVRRSGKKNLRGTRKNQNRAGNAPETDIFRYMLKSREEPDFGTLTLAEDQALRSCQSK